MNTKCWLFNITLSGLTKGKKEREITNYKYANIRNERGITMIDPTDIKKRYYKEFYAPKFNRFSEIL